MNKELKNVFISHVHEDDEGIDDLRNLIKKKGMEIRNSSITSDKPNNASSPDYIKSILRPHIEWASIVLVYISPETKDSIWVNWEIEEAHKREKIIIGVYQRGASGCEIPEALDAYADAVVEWNADKIINAINGECRDIETPNGTPRARRDISRHPCN